jgi:homoserine kinase type II
MAIYTKLSFVEVVQILKNYSLGNLNELRGIKEGIENTNYLLNTSSGKYILTVYEKRVNIKELPFFINLMSHLSSNKIICPTPISNNSGTYIFKIKNKYASISGFVQGKGKLNHSITACKSIGKNIAKLHLATKNLKITRKNNLSINSWIKLNNSIKNKANLKIPGIHFFINKILQKLKNNWPNNIPKGIIHADLFPDNIFFLKNKFSGFIDFYFACNDFLVYDLAICINAICFNKKNKLDNQKVSAILQGYSSIRKLKKIELDALPNLLMGAAIRFFLTRLHDSIYLQRDAIVKVKDPIEYLNKIVFHNTTTH